MSKSDKTAATSEQNGAVVYFPERPTGYPYPQMPAPQKDEDPLAYVREAQIKLDALRAQQEAKAAVREAQRAAIEITREPEARAVSFLDPFIEIMETVEEKKRKTAVDSALSLPAAWKESAPEERLEMIEQRKKLVHSGWVPMHAKSWFDMVVNFMADTHAAHIPYQVNLIRRARRELLNGHNRDLQNQKSLRECLRVVDGTHEPHKRYTYMGGAYPLLQWLEKTLDVYKGVEHQETRRFVLKRLYQLAPSSCRPRALRPAKAPKPAPTQG